MDSTIGSFFDPDYAGTRYGFLKLPVVDGGFMFSYIQYKKKSKTDDDKNSSTCFISTRFKC